MVKKDTQEITDGKIDESMFVISKSLSTYIKIQMGLPIGHARPYGERNPVINRNQMIVSHTCTGL